MSCRCNSRKVLGKSFWLEALKYVVILGLASLVYRAVRVSEFITCDVAASETLDNPAATESEKREATEAYLMCKFKFIGFELVLLAAVLLSAVYWAVFVGGPRRRQIRETLGIPVTDTRGACCSSCHNHGDYCNSDCCLHYWCTCCALAQETRTVLEAEREEREVRLTMPAGYTPLMAAPSSGADMERHTTTAGEKLMPILV